MRLIDADELINKYQSEATVDVFRYEVIEDLNNAPTVDAVPVRHGKWLWLDGVRCSQCNYKLATTGLPSYCPNCGARMDEEVKDND